MIIDELPNIQYDDLFCLEVAKEALERCVTVENDEVATFDYSYIHVTSDKNEKLVAIEVVVVDYLSTYSMSPVLLHTCELPLI